MRSRYIIGGIILGMLALLLFYSFRSAWQPQSSFDTILTQYVEKNDKASNKFLRELIGHLPDDGFTRCDYPDWRLAGSEWALHGVYGESYWFKRSDYPLRPIYLRLDRFPAPLYAFQVSIVGPQNPQFGVKMGPLFDSRALEKELNGWAAMHGANAQDAMSNQ